MFLRWSGLVYERRAEQRLRVDSQAHLEGKVPDRRRLLKSWERDYLVVHTAEPDRLIGLKSTSVRTADSADDEAEFQRRTWTWWER